MAGFCGGAAAQEVLFVDTGGGRISFGNDERVDESVKRHIKFERGKNMNAALEKYLNTIDRHLKPLPASERVDIVKEIKGSIQEMENEKLSTEQILYRLGDPKELAKAYLGDMIARGSGFSWSRFLTICAFYSVVGFSGLIVIPTLAIIAPVFILCAAICPLLGAAKLIDYILNLGIPYMDNIGFQFGSTVLGPLPVFFASVITGILLYMVGYGAWKLLVYYCRKVGSTKKKLSV